MSLGAEVVRIHPGRKRSIKSNGHLLYHQDFVPPENLVRLCDHRPATEAPPFPVNALVAALIATMPLEQYQLFGAELRQHIADNPESEKCRAALSWAAILWKALH